MNSIVKMRSTNFVHLASIEIAVKLNLFNRHYAARAALQTPLSFNNYLSLSAFSSNINFIKFVQLRLFTISVVIN